MKKKIIFTLIIAFAIIGVAAVEIVQKESKKEQEIIHFADVRLSYLKVAKKTESQIAFMLENITKNNALVNDKELTSLINQIQTIRSYGKDISKEAKTNLLKIIKILASKHYPNKALLLKLLNIAQSSQKLTA